MHRFYYLDYIRSDGKDVEAARLGIYWGKQYLDHEKRPAAMRATASVREVINGMQKTVSDYEKHHQKH